VVVGVEVPPVEVAVSTAGCPVATEFAFGEILKLPLDAKIDSVE
jgi:hypothetical protein